MNKTEHNQMIREIQLTNLGSLKKLDEICKKHNLQYWGLYGTLIGAIRHEGFIPWDDDLDVGMLRKDFEVLCNLPKEEWGDDCIFLYARSDDFRHDKMIGRVYQNNSKIQSAKDVKNWRLPSNGKPFYTSMMCDIYVFDEVSDDDQEHKKAYKKTLKAARLYKFAKYEYLVSSKSFKGKIKDFSKKIYGKYMRFVHKKPWKYFDDYCKNIINSVKPGKRIGTYLTTDPYLYDKEDYFPLQMTKFEDMEIPIPKNYEKVLKDMYGNYMEYPPEESRYHINFIYADLGNGKKYVVNPIKDSLGYKNQ